MSSRELNTAEAQLERILYILPAACRPGGTTIAALAEALGVSEDTVARDIEQVTAREFYHPAGSIDAFAVMLEDDRVEVNANDRYRRPVRLNTGEGLALELGLRAMALECEPARRDEVVELGRRIRSELGAPDVRPSAESPTDEDSAGEDMLLSVGDDVLRGTVSDAIAAKRICVMSYLKPGDVEPAQRRIAPQRLLYHDGFWYVHAYDYDRSDSRFFRLDRALDIRIEEASDASQELMTLKWDASERGVPYAAQEDDEVAVRYAPGIARWVAERTGATPEDDGSVVVRHRVADARWLVRHVLQYAGDAVVEDETYRTTVRTAAERLAR
jgi:predicted DNA-binding transcriptional regulator YafY